MRRTVIGEDPNVERSEEPARQETPFDFFRLRALILAPRMGPAGGNATEMVGILATAFGEGWLNMVAQDFSPSVALPLRKHPLGVLISTAGALQLADAFELAEYLRQTAQVPGLGEVITGLKASYPSAFLQLRTGARLGMAGATGIIFEPPAVANRASDIHCQVGTSHLRVECYRTTSNTRQSDEHIRLALRGMEIAASSPCILSIGVSLKVGLTAGIRKEIEGVLREAIKDITDRSGEGEATFPSILLEGEVATICVTRALLTKPDAPPILLRPDGFPEQGDDWAAYVRASQAPVQSITHAGAIDPHPAPGRSHIGVWLAKEDRATTHILASMTDIERLGRKIEAKLVQARTDSATARVLVVQTPLTEQIRTGPDEFLARLRGKIVTSHKDVAALVLLDRSWDEALGQHVYSSVLIAQPQLEEAVLRVLQSAFARG